MTCPHCQTDQTKVIDSRQHHGYRLRRYICLICNRRFTTKEEVLRFASRKRTDEHI